MFPGLAPYCVWYGYQHWPSVFFHFNSINECLSFENFKDQEVAINLFCSSRPNTPTIISWYNFFLLRRIISLVQRCGLLNCGLNRFWSRFLWCNPNKQQVCNQISSSALMGCPDSRILGFLVIFIVFYRR